MSVGFVLIYRPHPVYTERLLWEGGRGGGGEKVEGQQFTRGVGNRHSSLKTPVKTTFRVLCTVPSYCRIMRVRMKKTTDIYRKNTDPVLHCQLKEGALDYEECSNTNANEFLLKNDDR